MRARHRWLVLAVPAALAAVALAVPAASSAPPAAAPHVKAAAAAAGHANPLVHIVHRGLAKDCVYIQSGNTVEQIKGGGVNLPVALANPPGNCFNLLNKFTVGPFGTKTYTGYGYQNGDGHCLWDNGGTIDVGAACKAGHPNEEFFGVTLLPDGDWTVAVVTRGPNVLMTGSGPTCGRQLLGAPVAAPESVYEVTAAPGG
jgi:hypothetical protein